MAYRKFKRSRRYGGRSRRRMRRSFGRRVRRIAYSISEKKYYEYILHGDGGTVLPITTEIPDDIRDNLLYHCATFAAPQGLIHHIPKGYEQGQRIGDKIFVEYIQFTITVQFANPAAASSMGNTGCIMRYGVYLDRAHSQAVTPAPDLFTNFGGALHGSGAMRSIATLGRYKTLRDKQIRVAYNSLDTATGIPVLQEYIPIKREFRFKGSNPASSLDSSNMPMANLAFNAMCNHTDSCYYWLAVRVCYRDA